MSNKRIFRACLPALVLLASSLALAASGDGSIVGHITAETASTLSGAEVTARNLDTGLSRTVRVDADGSYRFPFLPVGTYSIEATKDGKSLGTLENITVNLGAATTADLELGGTTLDVITVRASRVVNAVDVTSTESATNISFEDLERLPVDKDLTSVALLAPGISRGHNFGGGAGLSFGGSSVAENTIYINGLNVTDFYNRIGFSSVPFAFYKEFQVKTGGYSVEFGRTTGGVINAVTRSGTNKFEFGSEITWEPDFLQTRKSDFPGVMGSHDEYNRRNYDVYASGPIVRDKLFFFALYEFRDYKPVSTDDAGKNFRDDNQNDGFWGAKVDWQINDKNLLELLAFTDKDSRTRRVSNFDAVTGRVEDYTNTEYEDTGGRNWAATYTAYLTSTLSAKALYGENQREFARNSQNDVECNRVRDQRGSSPVDLGCTSSANITAREDTRK